MKKRYWHVEMYEGYSATISSRFDSREEAEEYRAACGIPWHNTGVVEVDEDGRAL